jgi:hypothetical protein
MKKTQLQGATLLFMTVFALFNISVKKALADTPPPFLWVVQGGVGDNTDFTSALTVDGVGNAYAAGNYSGAAIFGSGTLSDSGAFITKVDGSGNYLWAQQISGAAINGPLLGVDASGDLYTAGSFSSSATFGLSGTITLNPVGSADAFVVKMNASTGGILWARQLGALSEYDYFYGLCVDGSGNIYVAGVFYGSLAVPTTTGTVNLVASLGNGAAFVVKMDASGNYIWAKSVGIDSSSISYGNAICMDGGNLYLTGGFKGTASFAQATGTATLNSTGGGDNLFVAKMNATTGAFVWATQAGGTSSNAFNLSYSVSSSGSNVYVSGYFLHNATFGGVTLSDTDVSIVSDAFIARLDSNGNFAWAKKLGTDSIAYGTGVDSSGHAYISGRFKNTASVITTAGTTQLICISGDVDAFTASLDQTGNFLWAKQVVGTYSDKATALGLDGTGNILLAGISGPASFDSLNLTGYGDFITKLGAPSGGSSVPVITSPTTATATLGVGFSYTIVATGSPSSYSASGLPGWAAFNPATGVLTGTAAATGTTAVTIKAINATGTGSATLTLVAQNPYITWRSTYFTPTEIGIPSISGDAADPNHNGISNLMEYALGLNPRSTGIVTGRPVRSSSGGYLTLSFNRQKVATDITYRVEATNDLTAAWSEIWSSSAHAYGGGANPSELVTVTDTTLMSASPTHRRFLRLKITNP